jgi:benzoyl-CoA reductase/2-hydroxyglutaryl-CoA dehydratase subunit BcrC/BadD/HgdB
MREVIDGLSANIVDRPAELKKLKDKGTKVVGFFPGDYVPDELIYAAGAVPICLVHGGNPSVVDASISVSSRFLCPFARAQMGEEVLKEQPYYNLIDMLVSPITCQHLRRAGDVWEYYSGIEVFRLGVPYKYDSEWGLEYYLNMLRLLRSRLEQVTGNTITDEKLREAIAVYNRMRALLKDMGNARKAAKPPISTLDFIKLNHASFYLGPAFMNDILANVLRTLESSEAHDTNRDRPRLLLTGPNVAYGDYKVLQLVEECGGDIVVEELLEGIRYYRENVATDGDPLRALAVKYLRNRVPPAFMRLAARKRFDFITRLAREFKVNGIIWYQLLYCDTYDIESYFFEKKLEGSGLPMLKLESDYTIQDRGPLKTRIEALLESIRMRG